MIVDPKHRQFFKKVAEELYVPMILNDYGTDKQHLLLELTNGISEIYKNLKYSSFDSVTILVRVDSQFATTLISSDSLTVRSYESLSQLKGKKIVIELLPNMDLRYLLDQVIDINSIRDRAIVYQYNGKTKKETFFGKKISRELIPIPDGDSWFAVQTYKDLEVALEDYGLKVARLSECVYLEGAWYDENRIFFKQKPERQLRDSLTQFLKARLRNIEGRPEQIVDKSHPVDIKITWGLANHLALIEIKWLGKSISRRGDRFTSSPNRKAANKGAKQLADYLDANRKQAPGKTTIGYLVVYDARRAKCNLNTKKLSSENGLKYDNKEIDYSPEYHKVRDDFAKPVRFFLEPKII